MTANLSEPPCWRCSRRQHEVHTQCQRNAELQLALKALSALVICAVAIGVVLIANSRNWSSDQWGAMGTWFAGLSTATSVWIAVWVAARSRASSLQALKVQIENERHPRQQEVVLALHAALKEQMKEVRQYMRLWQGYDRAETAGDETARVEVRNALLNYDPYVVGSTKFDDLIEPLRDLFLVPIVVISEPNVRGAVSLLQQDFVQLRNWMTNAHMNFPFGTVPPREDLEATVKSFSTHAAELIKASEKHLSPDDLLERLLST